MDQEGASRRRGGLSLNIPFSRERIAWFEPTEEPSEKPE